MVRGGRGCQRKRMGRRKREREREKGRRERGGRWIHIYKRGGGVLRKKKERGENVGRVGGRKSREAHILEVREKQ